MAATDNSMHEVVFQLEYDSKKGRRVKRNEERKREHDFF